jgi:hypothetical protein
LRATQEPQRVAAAALDAGIDLDALERAPLRAVLTDAQGMASASLSFPVVLPAHGASTVGWVAPLGAPTAPANLTQADLDARFDAVAQHWRERLNRTRLRVPAAAQPVVDTLRTHSDVARRAGTAAGHAFVRAHLGARRCNDGRRPARVG